MELIGESVGVDVGRLDVGPRITPIIESGLSLANVFPVTTTYTINTIMMQPFTTANACMILSDAIRFVKSMTNLFARSILPETRILTWMIIVE